MKNLKHWAKDYLKAAHTHTYALFVRKLPKHFLGFTKEKKAPVILIPGLLSTWHALRHIANKLSLEGHPIYILEGLGYNTKKISEGADLLDQLIMNRHLENVILVSHSKGGLIGKYLLAFRNSGKHIKKLITVATPFAGSQIVHFVPFKPHKELHPTSSGIKELQDQTTVNHKIVSIYGIFDNHVWPLTSCHLEGAKNIEVPIAGHHSLLSEEKVKEIILKEVSDV